MTASIVSLVAAVGTWQAGGDLPRGVPEEQGVDSAQLLKFVEALDSKIEGMHSVMVVRRGRVVAEGWWAPYAADKPHMLFSLSKSFTSTAVGIAAAEGKLRIDDPVLKFFPEDAPANPSGNLKAMRVSDLLRMNTGHQTEPPRKPNESWTKTFLAHPVPFKPGTHFLYNTSATYMLSAIVKKATGEDLLDYLKPRLFEPLGIASPTWEKSPQGISTGGYGLSVRTEDIAKFGQLYLQQGKWGGKQLVPAEWIAEASARQTSNGSSPTSDWDQGYGYQFWRCRNGAYRGDGAFGQYCIVIPEHDAVVAITSGVRDMQAVLNVVWDELVPAFKKEALSADSAANAAFSAKLKSLSMPTPKSAGSPSADVFGKKFTFPTNDAKLEEIVVELDPSTGGTILTAKFAGAERKFAVPKLGWKSSPVAWGPLPNAAMSVGGAWTAADTFGAKFCYVETPFVTSVKFQFAGDELRIESTPNVGFGRTSTQKLVGKRTP